MYLIIAIAAFFALVLCGVGAIGRVALSLAILVAIFLGAWYAGFYAYYKFIDPGASNSLGIIVSAFIAALSVRAVYVWAQRHSENARLGVVTGVSYRGGREPIFAPGGMGRLAQLILAFAVFALISSGIRTLVGHF